MNILAVILQTHASGGFESYQVPAYKFLLEIPECAFSLCVNLLLTVLLAVSLVSQRRTLTRLDSSFS